MDKRFIRNLTYIFMPLLSDIVTGDEAMASCQNSFRIELRKQWTVETATMLVSEMRRQSTGTRNKQPAKGMGTVSRLVQVE
ncbi:MAG: hypothetical protein IBX70_14480 [Clostridia bacterium]|nr:hypothetical protein [Clostridia bacterium]